MTFFFVWRHLIDLCRHGEIVDETTKEHTACFIDFELAVALEREYVMNPELRRTVCICQNPLIWSLSDPYCAIGYISVHGHGVAFGRVSEAPP